MGYPEIHQITPSISVWLHYDSAVKADLFSSALLTANGLYLVDPTPLPEGQLSALFRTGQLSGVIVTNANHARSAPAYSARFSVPVFAQADTFAELTGSELREVRDGSLIPGDLTVVEIPGAARGEIAIHDARNGGTLIVGDALINFEPYGFTFLPAKYCQNEKRMRVSLRKLLDRPAQRLLFAHGTPISAHATDRLRQLIEQNA